ncbi:hypothetical protein CPB86DRAFT_695887 [Serendipita vermifera]|nr:hypothetical protein CPB86DRAFT_695887 [Serendipita vermifera]
MNTVTSNAVDALEIGNETLSINKVYMWQNAMPSINTSGASNTRKGQHITVHIKRTPGVATGALSASPPKVAKLHVAQVSKVDDLKSVTSSNDEASYYAWSAPQLMSDRVAAGAYDDETAARREHFVLTRPVGWRGFQDEIELQAWDGPTWGQGKDFVAIVEFEGGKVLRSDPIAADVVY